MKLISLRTMTVACLTSCIQASALPTTNHIQQTKQQKSTPAPQHIKASSQPSRIKILEYKIVKQDEEFMIERPASPSLGRTWKLHTPLPMLIEQVGEAIFVPAKRPGKYEGTIVYTFKGTKPGSAKIELEKVYPPEIQHKKPLKIRIISVEIKKK
jgi:hypothetical protein